MFGRGASRRRREGRSRQNNDPAGSGSNVSSYQPWADSELGQRLAEPLGSDLDNNLQKLAALVPTADRRVARFTCLGGTGPAAAVVFIDGMTEKVALEDRIIRPLQLGPREGLGPFRGPRDRWLEEAGERLVPVSGHEVVATFGEAVAALSRGQSVLFLHSSPGGLQLSTQGWKERQVEAAPSETTIRGPKVGFTENLVANIALVRRHIQDPTLRIDSFELGVRSRTRVAVIYLEALARPAVVEEVERRLKRVDMDQIGGSQQLAELIAPGYHGPFSLHMMTERPDRVAYKLYLGKVAILLDGTPDALLVPVVLVENLISMDDFYGPAFLTSFQRILRLLAWAVVIFTPALYVAVMAYNPDVVKVDLAIVLAGARVGVPLNVVMEVVLLEVMMELLQEATVRLPSKIGSTATVVGGLIIGQAAAQARLVSNIMVVIVAMTAIASFAFPIYEHGVAWRIVKWVNVAAAATFGLIGLYISMTFIFFYLNSLESFGVPYLAPLSPLVPQDLISGILIRAPFWARPRRPKTLRPREREAAVTGEEMRP